MVRRPYAKRTQEDTLICPYTSCSTVSSKLSLVEKAVVTALAQLTEKYKLNDTLQDDSGTDVITAKETLIAAKQEELERLNAQKLKQYDLLEQGIYSPDVFLERSGRNAQQIKDCTQSIEDLEKELEHDRQLLAQKNVFIPHCENLLSNYWDWDVKTRNDVLKELIDRVEYTKDTKNAFRKGNEITFTLDLYPKIQ